MTSREGTSFLGAPCGTENFVRLHALQLMASNVEDLRTLRLLDTQSAILLLQQCVNRRMGYVARVVDKGYAEEALLEFDRCISRSLAKLVDIGECPDEQADQISTTRGFCEALGGLGIVNYRSPSTDLWLTCSRRTVWGFVEEFYPVLLPVVEAMLPTRLEVFRDQMLNRGDGIAETIDVRSDAATALSMYRVKRSVMLAQLRQQNRLKEARWLEDSSFPHSARWLRWSGGYSKKHLLWDSAEMKAAVRLRLLLPMSRERNAHPHLMCGCGANLSLDPWHCLDCNHNHHLWNRRHTLVRNCLGSYIRGLGGFTVSQEVPVVGTNKRSDLLIVGPGGRRQFLDVSIMNTCGNTAMASASGEEALRARALRKMQEYNGHVPANGEVVPFMLSVTAKMDTDTFAFCLQFLTINNKTKHLLKTKCFAEMSVILTQYCAKSMVASVKRATLAV